MKVGVGVFGKAVGVPRGVEEGSNGACVGAGVGVVLGLGNSPGVWLGDSVPGNTGWVGAGVGVKSLSEIPPGSFSVGGGSFDLSIGIAGGLSPFQFPVLILPSTETCCFHRV